MSTEQLSESSFITDENMTIDEIAKASQKNLIGLTETLKKEKNVNYYQLVFVATMINDVTYVPKKYYISCDEIANVIQSKMENLKRTSILDERAYILLKKAVAELIEHHQISSKTLDDLYMIKSEYFRILYN